MPYFLQTTIYHNGLLPQFTTLDHNLQTWKKSALVQTVQIELSIIDNTIKSHI